MINQILSSMSLDEVARYVDAGEYCGQDVLDLLYEENAKLRARVEMLEKVRETADRLRIAIQQQMSVSIEWEAYINMRDALKESEVPNAD